MEMFLNHLSPAQAGGRPRTVNICEVINAIFTYWRMVGAFEWLMPHDLPPWVSTVLANTTFGGGAGFGSSLTLSAARAGPPPSWTPDHPSAAMVDSASLSRQQKWHRKSVQFGGVGVKGHRHILVDTLGL